MRFLRKKPHNLFAKIDNFLEKGLLNAILIQPFLKVELRRYCKWLKVNRSATTAMWRFLYRRYATHFESDSQAAEACSSFPHAKARDFYQMSVLYILLSMPLTVVRFLAEKPHEEGYGQRPRVVVRAEFRGFRQMKN